MSGRRLSCRRRCGCWLWIRRSALIALAGVVFTLGIGAVASADPNEQDENGIAASDQSDDSADATTLDPAYAAAAPVPVNRSGTPAVPGSYTTENWASEDTFTPNGVNVVSSTGSTSFALTGVVTDANTGEPLANAQVRVRTYDLCNDCPPAPCDFEPCPPPTTPVDTNVTTDSAGSFAFINMISYTDMYDLVVTDGTSYGSYEVDGNTFAEGSYYETTVLLNSTNQQYDASATADQSVDQDAAANTLGTGYVSETRVPASILVAIYPQDRTCAKVQGSSSTPHRYPWKYYILGVMAGEIGSTWGPAA